MRARIDRAKANRFSYGWLGHLLKNGSDTTQAPGGGLAIAIALASFCPILHPLFPNLLQGQLHPKNRPTPRARPHRESTAVNVLASCSVACVVGCGATLFNIQSAVR